MPLLLISAASFFALLLMMLLALAEVIPTNDSTIIPVVGSIIFVELAQLVSTYVVYQAATKQYGWSVGLMLALCVLIGIIGWAVQIWFFLSTSENLKRHGLEVGIWGATKQSMLAFAAADETS
ncbi:MAG: hypothetical protein HONBIEJF_02638 [Fimbriimonadaceae bacterium]|nr:hypothetical protein [Fimbriimonadaceae bacterium]